MAEKSLLSIRGEVSWLAGDHSNVINSTKRMMSGMNSAIDGEMRAGQRLREQVIGEGLKKIEDQEKAAADRLAKNKQNAAERLSAIRVEARATPKRAKGEDKADYNARVRGIKTLVKAGEDAHSKLKEIQKRAGVDVSKTKAWSAEEFAGMDAGQRQGSIGRMRQATEELTTEMEDLQRIRKEMDSDEKASAADKAKVTREINAKKKAIDESTDVTSEAIRLDKEWARFEKEYQGELAKTSEAKKKLFKLDKEIFMKTIQMERDLKEASREVAEEIGRMRQEAGEGLRNAFTFATVAITAFWYKLTPLVETFKEFESELVNAQSIWQNSQEQLNELSDQVVQFGQKFGIEMGKATEGLYQYASAGVEAAEAMQMLNHTLTLSMAVQGDHNTLAKLTTQTIMGFGTEFSDAAEVTDKFAHAINMSLIEWDDLASSIKFALPFFTSTGQSLDQLLGALAVLTNRALEAGIAGRGLRQALAEFTQHAEDNSAAFHKMGVEILDVEGNMRELTDIAAQFQNQLGDGVNDMDVMMALMEDLNIRGATAFVHLVQNADEFQSQVDDLQNSAGAATSMAEVQQKSLANQIQLVKNALEAPFLMSEDMGENQEYLNSFAQQLHFMVQSFEDLIVVEKEGGKQLTEFGQFIKNFVIVAMKELQEVMGLIVGLVRSFGDQTEGAASMLHMFTVPIKIVLKLLTALGPEMMTTLIIYGKMNQILPLNTMNMYNNIQMRMLEIEMQAQSIEALVSEDAARKVTDEGKMASTITGEKYIGMMKAQVAAMMMMKLAMFSMIYLTQKYGKDSALAAPVIGALAGAFMGLAFAINATWGAMNPGNVLGGVFLAKSVAVGAAAGLVFNTLMAKMMSSGMDIQQPEFGEVQEFATGGRVLPMYANGGRTGATGRGHFPVMVEAGETIISKTQNMARGTGGVSGVTIEIHGDVYDGDNFAQKVGQALPHALRNVNDMGGM